METSNNTENISNPTAVTASIQNGEQPTIPSTIVETLAVKDRSKNGSEPVGGFSKGNLLLKGEEDQVKDSYDLQKEKNHSIMHSPTFMGKHNTSVPADKTATGTAVDSIDPEDQEEMLGDL